MVHFTNISNSWNIIAHRSVLSDDGYSHNASSLKGRAICLAHTLATPLKALSGLGRLVLSIIEAVTLVFAVLTLNAHPKQLKQVLANVIDVPVGVVLLPIAIVANLLRGVIGTIFHPGALIKDTEDYGIGEFKTEHNVLQGTFVNYPVNMGRARG